MIITSITYVCDLNVSIVCNKLIFFCAAITCLIVQIIPIYFSHKFLLVIFWGVKVKYSIDAGPDVNFVLDNFHLMLGLFIFCVLNATAIEIIIYFILQLIANTLMKLF